MVNLEVKVVKSGREILVIQEMTLALPPTDNPAEVWSTTLTVPQY